MPSSDLDLFSRTSSGEEAHEQLDDARRCAPAYKRGPRSNARVVVQTSISSDEEDLNPPQTQPKMSVDSCRVSASTGPRGTKRNCTGTAEASSSGTTPKRSRSFTGDHDSMAAIQHSLLENNELLKNVLTRLDKCEQKMVSLETKLDEPVRSQASTTSGSTPARKKTTKVPDEVRVRNALM